MTITINGTTVNIDGNRIIGFAKNNLVNRFEATTDKEEGWEYTLKAYMTKIDKINIINLNREGQNLFVDLTKDMLPVGGRYIMQFVAMNQDKVDQTEKFEVWVEDSLDPTFQYTPVPSEFYQIEKNILEANSHPPYPGFNGYWMIWNSASKKYEESNLPVGEGGSDKTFTFTQSVPSATWQIRHNLNKYPSVTIVDSGSNMVIGDIEYINENNLSISFSAIFSGKAYIN